MTASADEVRGHLAALSALYANPDLLARQLVEVAEGLRTATHEATRKPDRAALESLAIRLRAAADLACRLRAAIPRGGPPDA